MIPQEWQPGWGESVTFPITEGDVTMYNVAQATAGSSLQKASLTSRDPSPDP